jgi:FMN phosphatase YigB (HAD superfamily)
MVKAILFDFGQTLVDSSWGFRIAEKEAEARIFRDLGVESWVEFLEGYRRARQDFHGRSNFSRKGIWEQVYREYDREPDPNLLLQMEREYWATVETGTKLFPETVLVLGRLVAAYQLGLITNTQGQEGAGSHRLSVFPELEAFFEVVIVAGEAGVPPKPNAEPFLVCLERLGREPGETIYIGDDWEIDICGAQAVGIEPVWLQHKTVSRRWPAVGTSVPVIQSLEQLSEILDLRS